MFRGPEPSLWFVDVKDEGDADMAFLVSLFMKVFNADLFNATSAMMEVRMIGETVFGPYPRDIASTRINKASEYFNDSRVSIVTTLRSAKTSR